MSVIATCVCLVTKKQRFQIIDQILLHGIFYLHLKSEHHAKVKEIEASKQILDVTISDKDEEIRM